MLISRDGVSVSLSPEERYDVVGCIALRQQQSGMDAPVGREFWFLERQPRGEEE